MLIKTIFYLFLANDVKKNKKLKKLKKRPHEKNFKKP